MTKLDSPSKVIALIRVSSAAQAKDDRNGFERQQAYIDRHCKAYNLEVVKTVMLTVSGAYVQDEPGYLKMLAELPKLDIAGVVTATIDRFFRPAKMWQAYHETLTPFIVSGKKLYCDIGALNPADDMDMMKLFFQGEGAKIERRRIKERTGFALDSNRVRSDKKPAALPAGVKFENGNFSYTAESVRVKEAFERMTAGENLSAIYQDLGFATQTALRSSLRQYWWIGCKSSFTIRTSDGEKTKSGKPKRTKRETPILIETNLAATPLVSRSTFDHVQEILDTHHKAWTQRKTRTNEFLGLGLVYCACGAKMYAQTDNRRGYAQYYVCSNRHRKIVECSFPRFNIAKADQEIVWSVLSYMTDPAFIALKASESVSTDHAEKLNREIKIQQKNIADAKRKEANLTAMVADMGYTDAIKQQLKALAELTTAAKQELRKLQAEADTTTVDPEAVAAELTARFFGFGIWTREQQKAALAESVERIVFDGNGNAQFSVRVGQVDPARQAYIKSIMQADLYPPAAYVKLESRSCMSFQFDVPLRVAA